MTTAETSQSATAVTVDELRSRLAALLRDLATLGTKTAPMTFVHGIELDARVVERGARVMAAVARALLKTAP
jgi:hypothetical protein